MVLGVRVLNGAEREKDFQSLTWPRDWSTMTVAVCVTSESSAGTPFLLTFPRWIMKARLSFRLPLSALNPAAILDWPNPVTCPLWIVSACWRIQVLL